MGRLDRIGWRILGFLVVLYVIGCFVAVFQGKA